MEDVTEINIHDSSGFNTHSSDLCDVCSGINIAEYFKEERDDRVDDDTGFIEAASTAKRLGFLRDICLKASRCSFCWIIVQSVCTTFIYHETTPEALLENETGTTEPQECYLYSYCSAKDNEHGDDDPRSKVIRIGIAYRAGSLRDKPFTHDGQIGDIQLLDEDAVRIRGSKVFSGRLIGPRIDINLINHWLRLCTIDHGACCNGENTGPSTEPRNLLVIDVKQKCITQLPAGAEYLALSYCWPAQGMFQTLLANIDELSCPEALNKRWDELPGVIQDAIDLTFDLNKTYLWIDALCIVQDDQTRKMTQILQMDRVYVSALATIVPTLETLDADQACRGIPRYNTKVKTREQKVALVQGMHLAVSFESASGIINWNTRWGRRAWTYQECLLSRRILFFTESQVYFQCRHSMFCEDCAGEIHSTDVYFAPNTNLWNPGALKDADGQLQLGYGTLHLPRELYVTDEQAIAAYNGYVESYTSRQSTYMSDTLVAFRAIQNVLRYTMQTSFLYGIPEKYLDAALLFTICVDKPRAEQSIQDYPLNPTLPSWTWAAWNCDVNYVSYFPRMCLHREVDWFLICGESYSIALESKHMRGESGFPNTNNKEVSMMGTIPSEILPSLRTKTSVDGNIQDANDHSLLSCWTVALDLYLTGRVIPLGTVYEGLWPESAHFAISNGKGQWIGSILMDKIWVEACLDKTRPYRFILISRSHDVLPFRGPDVSLFDANLFECRPWCFLNVMMIEPLGNTARRLGVGTIHEDAWVQESPTEMLVKLE
ncbi:HET-domain-containing protein [Annulohypoxylon nitens]|nr:HET-domain-containing protein [Annulohypoxylon nitens]